MNTKQRAAWEDLVQQCKAQCARPFYSSINVASHVRSDAIVAADNLVELVTPGLADLLVALATALDKYRPLGFSQIAYSARAHAARIREALEATE